MAFRGSLDIANRALGHLGCNLILSPTEDSKNNLVMAQLYDQLRRIELRSSIWRYATRKVALRPLDTNHMLLVPGAWSSTQLYLNGSVVADDNGGYWISTLSDNTGNVPGGDNEAWESYFGPLIAMPWQNTTTYYSGELVYVQTGNWKWTIYQSMKTGNSDVPSVASAWNATTVYGVDQVVLFSGNLWRSLLSLNVGNSPADAPAPWSSIATYSSGQTATGSDNIIYTSQSNGNTGNDPTTDGGSNWLPSSGTAPAAWNAGTGYVQGQYVTGSDNNVYIAWLPSTNTNPVGDVTGTWVLSLNRLVAAWSRSVNPGASSTSWRVLPNVGLQNINHLYPIGSGPSTEPQSRNVYRLPAGWLREAPQDPKAGNNSFLGGPAGTMLNDWNYEGNYIVTGDFSPIIYRFIADIVKVSEMDELFCDGLAYRMAIDACEELTQSGEKQAVVAQKYEKFMSKAKLINGIDIGPVEPPEDEWITVRQ